MDITQLILDDHHEQRRLFAMHDEIDDDHASALAAVWGRLAAFLEVHAKSEEDLFYPALIHLGQGAGGKPDARAETLDAIKDHNDIRDAIARVGSHKVGSVGWREAIAAVARANGEHMDEEERQGLTDFRRHASLKSRHELAVAFAAFETANVTGVRPVDEDPAAYIAENS